MPDSGVSKDARASLHRYAAGKLAEALQEAEKAWEAERAELVDRRALINEAADALHENVEDEAREKRNLAREAVAVAKQLQEFAQAGAQAFLVEWGLLPNYSLVEDGVRLEAALTRKEPARRARGTAGADADKAPASQWRTETRTYTRPSESALTELAPGNSYYVLATATRSTASISGHVPRRTRRTRVRPWSPGGSAASADTSVRRTPRPISRPAPAAPDPASAARPRCTM